MLINRTSVMLALAAALPSLTGCVDDNYDLSDVDTTVRVGVNDLVIPVNIDKISLGTILDIDSEDKVKIVDGHYAVVDEGTFSSDVIKIDPIRLSTPAIAPSEVTVNLKGASASVRAAADGQLEYNLVGEPSNYSFDASFVSDFIVSIDVLGCDLSLDINISLRGVENYVTGMTFEDVVLQIPKGLKLTDAAGGTYSAATGELKLPSRRISGTKLTLHLAASGVDFVQAGGKYDYAAAKVSMPGSMYLKSGKAVVAASDLKAGAGSLPRQITLRSEYKLSDAVVTSFTGKVRYDIDGANLSDIDLSDLPDVLSQPSTNLSFVNPMIYLQVENPLQKYSLYARTGLDITAFHGTEESKYALDDPFFQIGPDNANGVYNFCLSPSMPKNIDAAFAGAVHVPFTSLSHVLSGNGVPRRLSISLLNPGVPVQEVTGFKLGEPLGNLNGKYKFVAPLEFTDGSTIVYTDKVDGWSSEDLDHVTVQTLEVTLTVSTDIPVNVKFTGYPIDAAGKRINNVSIEGADINANADNQKVTIRITGEIRGLDGIEFEAKATATNNSAPLSPDMNVVISQLRPKVSGYYEKEL